MLGLFAKTFSSTQNKRTFCTFFSQQNNLIFTIKKNHLFDRILSANPGEKSRIFLKVAVNTKTATHKNRPHFTFRLFTLTVSPVLPYTKTAQQTRGCYLILHLKPCKIHRLYKRFWEFLEPAKNFIFGNYRQNAFSVIDCQLYRHKISPMIICFDTPSYPEIAHVHIYPL